MATNYVTNFPIPGAANIFQLIWKLTRVMKASGWTTQASSDGVAKETTGGTNDKWGGHVNPLLDVYVTDTNNLTDSTDGGWIVLRGPSTLKMPLNALPSGTLIRGETITQVTSNAEGELLGFVWDTASSTGWAVIAPHTGTFDMTHTVTGSTSTATFVPLSAGTLVTYFREVLITRDTSSVANGKIIGSIHYICVDSVAENAQLFSVLATQTGCTATVPPGGGGTSNAYPSKGIVIKGSNANGVTWFFNSNAIFTVSSNGQIVCINATPTTGVTADGSFYACCSDTSSANGVAGFIFTRLDDTEPGDVDPYAWYSSTSASLASSTFGTTRTAGNTIDLQTTKLFASSSAEWIGYQARGNVQTGGSTSRDVIGGWIGTLMSGQTNTYIMDSVNSSAFTLVNHPNPSPPQLREPIMLYNNAISTIVGAIKQIKGRTRWIMAGPPIGTSYDTYDNKNWLVVNVSTATTSAILLPYDGSTIPTQ